MWNLDALISNSLLTPPDTQAAFDAFFLQFCHQNPSSCEFIPAGSTADDLVADFERRLNIK
jgi:hypothetical protein